jgi:O-antigen/teichoic acid export membrane protein
VQLRHRALIGVVWAFTESWGAQLFQLIVFLILARLLGPESYGLVAIAMPVVMAGQLFVSSGGWVEVLVQRRDLDAEYCDTAFLCVVVVGATLSAAGMAGAPALGWLFGRPDLVGVVRSLAVIPALSSLAIVPQALLQRELRFSVLALRSNLATLGSGMAGVLLAVSGAGVWSLVAQEIALRALSLLVLWGAHSWRPRLRFSGRAAQAILACATPTLGAGAAGFGEDLLLRGVLGYVFGPSMTGQFFLARKIVDVLRELLVAPWTRVALPVFARLQDRPDSLDRTLGTVAHAAAFVSVPGYLGLFAVAPVFVAAALGSAWHDSVPMLRWLILAGLLTAVGLVLASLLQAAGRFRLELRLRLAATMLLLGLTPFGVLFGPAGVAGAVALRSLLALPIRLTATRRVLACDLRSTFRPIWPVLAAGVLMAASVGMWRWGTAQAFEPTAALALCVLVGAASYLLGLLAFARSSLAEALAAIQAIMQRSLPAAKPLKSAG